MAHQNCYCINPLCNQPDYPDNYHSNFCHQCGSNLFLNGKYRVEHLLSSDSGFGIIYEAKFNNSRKILKVLKPEHNNNPKIIELFKQEYQVLYNLTFQKITGIPQVENDDYFQYKTKTDLILHCIVMEKVDGIDLIQWLKNNGQISQKQAIKWLREITQILAKIHQKNYFHRDIKPHNIMQRNNGELVLIDFGTAREETQTYYQKLQNQQVTEVNSVGYTPVEQQNGQAVMQSDFFALGRTFVHLLTDKHPLDIYDSYNNVFNWRSYTDNINPLLLDFIDELMAVSAKDRPANTTVILQRLNDIESAINQGNTPVNYPNPPISSTDSFNYPPNIVPPSPEKPQNKIGLNYPLNIAAPSPEKPQNKIGLILIFIFSLSLPLFLGWGILFNLNKQTQNNNNNKNPNSPETQTTKNPLSSPQISSNSPSKIIKNPSRSIQKPPSPINDNKTSSEKSNPPNTQPTANPSPPIALPRDTININSDPTTTITPDSPVEEIPEKNINSSPQISPKESIGNYFQAINNSEYETAWNQLPISIQNNQKINPNGYDSFVNWFSSIKPLKITRIDLITQEQNTAVVEVSYRYVLKGKIVRENLRYNMIYNAQKQGWDIQSIENLKS